MSVSKQQQNRPSRSSLLTELLLVLAVGLMLTLSLRELIYPWIGWPQDAPMPGRTIALAAIILLLVRNSQGLASIGLHRRQVLWVTIVLTLGILLANLFLLTPVKDFIRDLVGAPRADLGVLLDIHGNVPILIGWLIVAWTAAAFGEEIIFRGFLLTRIETLTGGGALATALAVTLQGVLFGLGHAYQGMGAALTIGLGAIVSGAVFVLTGRSLWPLILAHGIWDTLGLTLIYFNGAPET